MASKRGAAVKFLIFIILAVIVIVISSLLYTNIYKVGYKSGSNLKNILNNTAEDIG